jgi:ABC-type multidrug transport system fused ATPase/permease subunit
MSSKIKLPWKSGPKKKESQISNEEGLQESSDSRPSNATPPSDDIIPIQLHFENLKYSVPVKKKKRKKFLPSIGTPTVYKTLIEDMNGTFEPGTLTGIMGSSGAGILHLTCISILKK